MYKISDIPLDGFERPIRTALGTYEDITGNSVQFDADQAVRLERSADKPYAAKSVSDLEYRGSIGSLVVVVFDMDDATGDESSHHLSLTDGVSPLYQRRAKFTPRSKDGIDSEAHITIAAQSIGFPIEEHRLFAGNLDLIGFRPGRIGGRYLTRLAGLGQDTESFYRIMSGEEEASPTATLTTGYDGNERFGDPHAVYNREGFVQVAGFISVKEQDAAEQGGLLRDLRARIPDIRY